MSITIQKTDQVESYLSILDLISKKRPTLHELSKTMYGLIHYNDLGNKVFQLVELGLIKRDERLIDKKDKCGCIHTCWIIRYAITPRGRDFLALCLELEFYFLQDGQQKAHC
jgi:hypothetical protein